VPPDRVRELAESVDPDRDLVPLPEAELSRRHDSCPGEQDASRSETLVASEIGDQVGDRPPHRRRGRCRLEDQGAIAPDLELDGAVDRDYLLFTGSVVEGEGWQAGPNLWWPNDRAWMVANEIDLDWYSLIGGTHALCVELTALGARPVTVDDPL
jgi:hypothetical protein